ncbi:MAG: leucine-rich repeat domain-containing protein, partial [Paludibacteraceae bacterium]|nr:leucine-rich repeat domain-containing protein [Paludibacteraceae bacterium]
AKTNGTDELAGETFTKETYTYKYSTYQISVVAEHGIVFGGGDYEYLSTCTLSVVADFGYEFVAWSDGITKNPRVIQVSQDTILNAVFRLQKQGLCGDNLLWKYEDRTLSIYGTGAMYDYKQDFVPWLLLKDSITSLVINSGCTSIGDYAFYGLSNKAFKSLSLPDGIISIGNYAFAECGYLGNISLCSTLEEIGDFAFANDKRLYYVTCYAMEPPLLAENAFYNYDAILSVPCEAKDIYMKVAPGWKKFNQENAKCIGAETVENPVTEVATKTGDTEVTITWPTSTNAATYTIEISSKGVLVCTLVFNADGILTSINFPVASAPARFAKAVMPKKATLLANGGMQFTVTGLDSGTDYTYVVIIGDAQGQELDSFKGEFKTTGEHGIATAIDEVTDSQKLHVESQKFIRNGVLHIERNGKTYNALGGEVR